MSNKTDILERIADALDGGGNFGQGTVNEVGYLERIANALDGGGDFGQGTVNEISYLERIANYLEENGINSGSGGGGSSDYTTATIAVTENGDINGIISAPIIFKGIELTTGYIETVPYETNSYTIILPSSGISQIYIPPEKIDVISISGDIEDYTDGYYGITGDCAITVETNTSEQH